MTSRHPSQNSLIGDCYSRSLEILKNNLTPSGVIACSISEKSVDRNYAGIFGRDAAICAIGMALSGDEELRSSAAVSLSTLAAHQAPNGQIPKYVKPEEKEVDFWYSGCIDATLWWLIAVSVIDRVSPEEGIGKKLDREIGLALNWLFCQEHQGMYLLQQNEASDWADIMPRSGFVLYSNALWYHVKRLYNIPAADRTKLFFNQVFYPFDKSVPEQRRIRILRHYVKRGAGRSIFYLSFVNFSFFGEEVDVFGNILAALLGLSTHSEASRMVGKMLELKINEPYPVKTVHEPIARDSPLWRPYMERYRQNLPFRYHNGGIWPFIGGFWVILLTRLGKQKLAWKELERVAEANRIGEWGFNEWFHGETGEPMGMRGQSWNAALYILAYQALKGKFSF